MFLRRNYSLSKLFFFLLSIFAVIYLMLSHVCVLSIFLMTFLLLSKSSKRGKATMAFQSILRFSLIQRKIDNLTYLCAMSLQRLSEIRAHAFQSARLLERTPLRAHVFQSACLMNTPLKERKAFYKAHSFYQTLNFQAKIAT